MLSSRDAQNLVNGNTRAVTMLQTPVARGGNQGTRAHGHSGRRHDVGERTATALGYSCHYRRRGAWSQCHAAQYGRRRTVQTVNINQGHITAVGHDP